MAEKVYAYRIGGKLHVAPSPVIVGDGDKVDLVNLTDDELDWTFPRQVFGTQGKKTFKTDKKNKKRTDRTKDHDAPANYDYHVEKVPSPLAGAKRKAKRTSLELQNSDDFADPVIIIET